MDNSHNDNDAPLIPFLRELADLIESKQLQPDQLKCIGEFYISYKMNEHLNERDDNCNNDFEEMDIIKFLTLGWFFYTQLINKNPENSSENDKENSEPVDSTRIITDID